MKTYALILDGAELRRADFDGEAPTLAPNKGKWVPVIRQPRPDFNPLDQAVDPMVTIGEGALAEGWVVRPCTPEERSAALATVNAPILGEIAALEAQQTPRRLREAALTEEGRQWLAALDSAVAGLRVQLQR